MSSPASPPFVAIRTARLLLEPITAGHAEAMFRVLDDPSLYRYMPSEIPRESAWLRERYARLSLGASPDASELWLNWVVSCTRGSRRHRLRTSDDSGEPRLCTDGMDDWTRRARARVCARIRPCGVPPSDAQWRRRGSGDDRRAQRAVNLGGGKRRVLFAKPPGCPRTCSMGSAAPTITTSCALYPRDARELKSDGRRESSRAALGASAGNSRPTHSVAPGNYPKTRRSAAAIASEPEIPVVPYARRESAATHRFLLRRELRCAS